MFLWRTLCFIYWLFLCIFCSSFVSETQHRWDNAVIFHLREDQDTLFHITPFQKLQSDLIASLRSDSSAVICTYKKKKPLCGDLSALMFPSWRFTLKRKCGDAELRISDVQLEKWKVTWRHAMCVPPFTLYLKGRVCYSCLIQYHYAGEFWILIGQKGLVHFWMTITIKRILCCLGKESPVPVRGEEEEY